MYYIVSTIDPEKNMESFSSILSLVAMSCVHSVVKVKSTWQTWNVCNDAEVISKSVNVIALV